MKTLSLSQEYFFVSTLAEKDRPLFKGLLKGEVELHDANVLYIMPVTLGMMVRCKGSYAIGHHQLFRSTVSNQEYLVFRTTKLRRPASSVVYTVSESWHQNGYHFLKRLVRP